MPSLSLLYTKDTLPTALDPLAFHFLQKIGSHRPDGKIVLKNGVQQWCCERVNHSANHVGPGPGEALGTRW